MQIVEEEEYQINKEINSYIKEKIEQNPESKEIKDIPSQMSECLFAPKKFYQTVYYRSKNGAIIRSIFLLARLFKKTTLFKTKENCRKYNHLLHDLKRKSFKLISETMDEVIPMAIDSAIDNFVDVKDLTFGDKRDFIGEIKLGNGSVIEGIDFAAESARSMRGNAQVISMRTGRSLVECMSALAFHKNNYKEALRSLQEENQKGR